MKFPLLTLLLALLVSTSHAGITIVGNLARHTTLKAGETFEGVILLKNTDPRPAEARVFQTDYLSDAAGHTDYAAPGSTPRSNAPWITITPTRIIVGAGETVSVRYKGRAPADAKLRGTYWSVVMVEPAAAAATDPQGKAAEVAVGVQTVIRFGVQIVTEIGREGTRSLQILDKGLGMVEGKRLLHLDVGNNGERLLIPAMGVELFDANGASFGKFDAGRARIYPTCSTRAKIDLTDVPPGKYTALVLLDSGDDQVLGAQYDLAIEP